MANCYWIDTTGLASWDDNIAGVTPWGSAIGVADNAANPVNGDSVYFDNGAGTTALVNGPAAPVSLAELSTDSYQFAMTAAQTVNITIANSGVLFLNGASEFGGVFGNSVTATFIEASINSGTANGTGCVFVFQGTSTNSQIFTNNPTVSFTGAGTTNAALVTTSVAVVISGTLINNATITAPATLTAAIGGVGSIVGAVAIGGGGSNNGTITGGVTITGTGANTGTIIGNVTASGTANCNTGTINGNLTLSNTAKQTGIVTGTLTAPAEDNGDGTWGTPQDALGTFGTLKLTGIPSGSDMLGAGLM